MYNRTLFLWTNKHYKKRKRHRLKVSLPFLLFLLFFVIDLSKYVCVCVSVYIGLFVWFALALEWSSNNKYIYEAETTASANIWWRIYWDETKKGLKSEHSHSHSRQHVIYVIVFVFSCFVFFCYFIEVSFYYLQVFQCLTIEQNTKHRAQSEVIHTLTNMNTYTRNTHTHMHSKLFELEVFGLFLM